MDFDKRPDKSAPFIHLGISLILLISWVFQHLYPALRHNDLPLFLACYASSNAYIVSDSVAECLRNVMSFNTSQGWRFRSVWFKRYGKEVERHLTHKLRICKCSAIFDMIRKPQRLYIVSDSVVECLRNVMSFNTSHCWCFSSVWFKRYVCFAVFVTT